MGDLFRWIVYLGLPSIFTVVITWRTLLAAGHDVSERLVARYLFNILFPTALAVKGFQKKSLNLSGAVSGWLVGFVACCAGLNFAFILLVFFVTSSALTKMGAKRKKAVDSEYKDGGQRDWYQVGCNGGWATACAFAHWYFIGTHDSALHFSRNWLSTSLQVAYAAHYACCNGDTWASEIGTAIDMGNPRLITTLKTVPTGTNGALSLPGTLASFFAGVAIGLTIIIGSWTQGIAVDAVSVSLLFGTAGLFGSAVDSLLGATLQFSGWSETKRCVVNYPGKDVKHICGVNLFTNNQVNLFSSFVTSLIVAYIIGPWLLIN